VDNQFEADMKIALASLLLLPEQMRTGRTAGLIMQALRNPDAAKELQEHPRAVLERECGHVFPSGTSIEVHVSTPAAIHLVLPMLSAGKQRAAARVEITDEDLISKPVKHSALNPIAIAMSPPDEAYINPRK
jgi:hypothetical protein